MHPSQQLGVGSTRCQGSGAPLPGPEILTGSTRLKAGTAQKMVLNMLSTGAFYCDPGNDFYARLNPDKAKNRAIDQLRKMGYAVTLNPLAATG